MSWRPAQASSRTAKATQRNFVSKKKGRERERERERESKQRLQPGLNRSLAGCTDRQQNMKAKARVARENRI